MKEIVQDRIVEELVCAVKHKPATIDIIIVVRNQIDYTKACLESLQKNSPWCNLYIWNNNSVDGTKEYLEQFKDQYYIETSDENSGFLLPNNRLAEKTKSEYIILLNNDTVVLPDWDKVLVSWLQNHPETKIVGYQGSFLGKNAQGCGVGYGDTIDYISGWCLCIHRDTYNQFGLFDEKNLKFAYGEDSDFSLRVKEAGYKIYAMYSDLVLHFGSKTAKVVLKESNLIQDNFEKNHEYLRKRWADYLKDKE